MNTSLLSLLPRLLLVVLLGGGSHCLRAQSVIPVPLKMQQADGSFTLDARTRLCLDGPSAEVLRAWQAQFGFLRPCAAADGTAAADSFPTLCLRLVPPAPDASPEGYALHVSPRGIRLEAGTDTGLYYGLQTLAQLASPAGAEAWTVPYVDIEDKPRFRYRGFMMDVSRHFRSKEFVKKQMDVLARYKMNRLHLHLTDGAGWRLQIDRYPRLTELAAWRTEAKWKDWWFKPDGRRYCEEGTPGAYGGYYTKDDIRELLAYAADRHITLVPEIEMPAHSEEVLAAYPELACSGEPYRSAEFCIGNEQTFRFLEDVLSEVMELFPSEYIHIGGDEANKNTWKACPKCRRRMEDEGLKDVDELQSYAVRRIARFLQQHGRKLLGWDEIMQGGLAEGATVMSWRGEAGGLQAVRSGHRAVMTPSSHFYLDYYQDAPPTQPEAIGGYVPLEKVYAYDPVKPGMTPAETALLEGVQANLWAEYIPTDEQYEYMMYPRLLAVAEVGWSAPARKDYADFRRRALRAVDTLAARGYHPFPLKDEAGHRPESLQPVGHLALHKPVTYNAPYSPTYAAAGAQTLTDGLRGDWTYSDGRWQGFIAHDRLDVTIDLGRPTDIGSIEADFMQVAGPEVFLPARVIISVSDDGQHFAELLRETYPVSREPDFGFARHAWTGRTRARYVRYQARSGSELGGWIFTDEIVVLPPR